MEEVLTKIREDPICKFNPDLTALVDDALELLNTDATEIARVAPAFRLRERCFQPFKSAFNSKSKTCVKLVIDGIQLMWHDDRFHSNMAAEIPAMWTGVQILDTVENLPNLPEELQFLTLEMLQRMIFSTVYALNVKVILDLYELCKDVYIATDMSSLKSKSKSVVESALQSFSDTFCTRDKTQSPHNEEMADLFGCDINSSDSLAIDAVEIIRFILRDVSEGVTLSESNNSASASKKGVLSFALDAILCFIEKLPPSPSLTMGPFGELVWQNLCPQLVGALGRPVLPESQRAGAVNSPRQYFSSTPLVVVPEFLKNIFLCVYKITYELLRLTGMVESLRPVLQALLHRVLFISPIEQRKDALEILSRIFDDLVQLCCISGPAMIKDVEEWHRSTVPPAAQMDPLADVAILKLIFDGAADLVQIDKSNAEVEISCLTTSVSCVEKLLRSLHALLQDGVHELISLNRILQLKDYYLSPDLSNFSKPLTPTEEEKEMENSENGKIERNDDDENDNVFIDDDATEEVDAMKKRTLNDTKTFSRTSSKQDDVASELGLRASAYVTRDSTSSETGGTITHDGMTKYHAGALIADLTNLIPKLNQTSTLVALDDTLMTFASEFCEKVLTSSQKDSQSVTIVNADGIYLLCCNSLKFLDEMTKSKSSEVDCKMTKEVFQQSVFEGGALVYLSKHWISNVYDQLDKRAENQIVFKPILSDFLNGGFDQSLISKSCGRDPKVSPKKDKPTNEITQDKAAKAFVKRIVRTCHGPIIEILHKASRGWRTCSEGSFLNGKASLLSFNSQELCPKERLLQVRATSHKASECFQKLLEICHILDQDAIVNLIFKCLADVCNTQPISYSTNELEKKLPASPAKNAPENGKDTTFQSNALKLLERKLPENVSKALHMTTIQREIQQVERDELDREKQRQRHLADIRAKHLHCFHACPVFSFKVILATAGEAGYIYPEIWGSVLRSYLHLHQIEYQFCSVSDSKEQKSSLSSQKMTVNLTSSLMRKMSHEENASVDRYATAFEPNFEPICHVIDEISKNCGPDSLQHPDIGGCLPKSQTSLLLTYFTAHFDVIFENAVLSFSSKALSEFLNQLGLCLRESMSNSSSKPKNNANGPTFLLQRLSDSILHICQSDHRPFYQVLKCWHVVHPFLLAAASYSDPSVSHLAIETLYKVVTTLIIRVKEKKHFHFHEAFLKPFENILCLDICDAATQDHVLNVLCTLVEGYTEELGSGWRPLFAALRHIHLRYSEGDGNYTQSVLDIFQAFFGTDNMSVFANAALDVILVILKFLRGGGASVEKEILPPSNKDPYSDSETESDNEDFSGETDKHSPEMGVNSLCLPAFRYLKETADIFSSMYKMLDCPTFPAAHWIKLTDTPQKIDSKLPFIDHDIYQRFSLPLDEEEIFKPNPSENPNVASFDPLRKEALSRLGKAPSFSSYPTPFAESTMDFPSPTETISDLDPGSGILHVWFLLVEGVASTITSCPQIYQPQAMQLLFDMIVDLGECPGPKFGIYCINALLLPTLQTWLRKEIVSEKNGFWDLNLSNFKQCFGLATTLITNYVVRFSRRPSEAKSLTFMLKQFFDVLIEGISIPNESIARLACSCVKHLISRTNVTVDLLPEMWDVTCASLRKACHVSLYPLKRLMTCFREGSDQFYGDLRQLRVGARKSGALEANHLRQLALQVFLVESQRMNHLLHSSSDTSETPPLLFSPDEKRRSYVFLIYDHLSSREENSSRKSNNNNNNNNAHQQQLPANKTPDEAIEFRQIVLGLMTHQLLTQTIGCLLLRGSARVIESEEEILGTDASVCFFGNKLQRTQKDTATGCISRMSTKNYHLLLDTLEESSNFAHDFDARPGLKILLQNVIQGKVALNLYQNSSVCFLLYFHSLLEICLNTRSSPKGGKQFQKRELLRFRKGIKEYCQLYIDFQLDKYGNTYITDALAEKPMYFLLAKFDDLPNYPLKPFSKENTESDKNDTQERDDTVRTGEPSSSSPEHRRRRHHLAEMIYSPATESEVTHLRREFRKKKRGRAMPCHATVPSSTSGVDERGGGGDDGATTVAAAAASSPTPQLRREVEDDERRGEIPESLTRVLAAGRSRRYKSLTPILSTGQRPRTPKVVDKDDREREEEEEEEEEEEVDDPVAMEIEQIQKKSLMKDGEARHNAFVSVLIVIFDLLVTQTSSEEFKFLIPQVFETANQLISHATDSKLREQVSFWFKRLGEIYDLNVDSDSE